MEVRRTVAQVEEARAEYERAYDEAHAGGHGLAVWLSTLGDGKGLYDRGDTGMGMGDNGCAAAEDGSCGPDGKCKYKGKGDDGTGRGQHYHDTDNNGGQDQGDGFGFKSWRRLLEKPQWRGQAAVEPAMCYHSKGKGNGKSTAGKGSADAEAAEEVEGSDGGSDDVPPDNPDGGPPGDDDDHLSDTTLSVRHSVDDPDDTPDDPVDRVDDNAKGGQAADKGKSKRPQGNDGQVADKGKRKRPRSGSCGQGPTKARRARRRDEMRRACPAPGMR